MSNSLDPDQARLSVGPDLDPNCLQRLSADVKSRQKLIDKICPSGNPNHSSPDIYLKKVY